MRQKTSKRPQLPEVCKQGQPLIYWDQLLRPIEQATTWPTGHFPSWMPCVWEQACSYLPSMFVFIAFIYGCVIVWWPFVFFWQRQWLFCCNINEKPCPWAYSRSFSQHSGHKHWAGRLPGRLRWPAVGPAAPALPRMLVCGSAKIESCLKTGLGHNFSWYTSWRKRSEHESSLKVRWRHLHQDLVHSELQIFLGPGYWSSQETCLEIQAMSLFNSFLPGLIFFWKVEAN